MKAYVSIPIMAVIISLTLAMLPIGAAFSDENMDHTGHVGEKIHTSTINGYALAYHILDLPGKTERHLMVYIKDPQGKTITSGKTGYLIKGPDGKTQKVMAMAMKEAFGGDVDFTAKGSYAIRVKAVVGDDKLIDAFNFTVP